MVFSFTRIPGWTSRSLTPVPPLRAISTQGTSAAMFDPDFDLILLFLVLIVVALLLAPPGPGTPLKAPVR